MATQQDAMVAVSRMALTDLAALAHQAAVELDQRDLPSPLASALRGAAAAVTAEMADLVPF